MTPGGFDAGVWALYCVNMQHGQRSGHQRTAMAWKDFTGTVKHDFGKGMMVAKVRDKHVSVIVLGIPLSNAQDQCSRPMLKPTTSEQTHLSGRDASQLIQSSEKRAVLYAHTGSCFAVFACRFVKAGGRLASTCDPTFTVELRHCCRQRGNFPSFRIS